MERLGGYLAPWKHFGGVSGASWNVLGASWERLAGVLKCLGGFRKHLGEGLGLLKGVWGRHGGNQSNDFQIKADNFQIKADDFQNKAYDFQSLEARFRAGATGRGRGGGLGVTTLPLHALRPKGPTTQTPQPKTHLTAGSR